MSQHKQNVRVSSPHTQYSKDAIVSDYYYDSVVTKVEGEDLVVEPLRTKLQLKTNRNTPKLGVMVVGLGGNNGTTMVGGIIANREGLTWRTKEGVRHANYYGSMTQCSTVRLGANALGEDSYVPMNSIVPMTNPNDFVIGGWDINDMNLADAMERARVFDYDLQRQLRPLMEKMKPLPSIYIPDFIAANQKDRANNVLKGTKQQLVDKIRTDIREFKETNKLDKVIILWSANTERYAELVTGVNDTADNLLKAIERGEQEISPSTLFAVASVLEGCSYINGSPQNTFVPGAMELAERHNVLIGGDDFKTGQTKIKSVLVDFLISSGIKPSSIVSYNHLGNNDGKNLSAPQQFRSKEISKSTVVDDMVNSNNILYKPGEHPDHVVVIKYVPFVGDSKRALDEYTSEIFMGGLNTISMHNTCEDSLLATPVMIDLIVLTELMERISYKTATSTNFEKFHPVLSILSFLLKAPLVPKGTPVVNALFKQRACIENLLRACVGLPPENNMLLECKVRDRSAFERHSKANGNGPAH